MSSISAVNDCSNNAMFSNLCHFSMTDGHVSEDEHDDSLAQTGTTSIIDYGKNQMMEEEEHTLYNPSWHEHIWSPNCFTSEGNTITNHTQK